MDIKTRIDGLTEQEAKAALGWTVTQMALRRTGLFDLEDVDDWKQGILNEALKEARKCK